MPTNRSYRSAVTMMLVAGGLVAAVPAYSAEFLCNGRTRGPSGQAGLLCNGMRTTRDGGKVGLLCNGLRQARKTEFLCDGVRNARGAVKVSKDSAVKGITVGCNSHVENRARKTEFLCDLVRNARGAGTVGIQNNGQEVKQIRKVEFNCNALRTARQGTRTGNQK